MRNDADDHFGCLHLVKKPGVKIDLLPVRNEGIDSPVVDNVDFYGFGLESGRKEDGIRVFPEHVLDFGVPDG